MSNRALPIEVTNILEKLEFISRIPSGYKANIPDKTLQHKDSWWGALTRGRKNVDRKSTLRDIQTTIDETVQVLSHFSRHEDYIKLIINALRRIRHPIQEMAESTYGNDVCVVSDISVKIKTIDIYLSRYKKYLDPVQNISDDDQLEDNYESCVADLIINSDEEKSNE